MCTLACRQVYELSTRRYINAWRSYVDGTTGKERQRWGVPIGQAHQRTSDQCAHQSLNRLCEFAGAHTRVSVWGYVVVCVKTNSIPAVSDIPGSHTHFLTAPGIMLPLGLLDEALQSPTVLDALAICPQLAPHLAWQIFYFPVVVCLLF